MHKSIRQEGVRAFTMILAGQLISLLGSGLTGFALGLWVYQTTGSVSRFALISVFTVAPRVLLAPLAGALADRWNRRLTMIGADAGAALATLAIALLLSAGRIEVWHIYLATAFISASSAFQWPAYAASVSMLVPKEHLGRASGMVQAGQGMAQTFAPAMAGALLVAPAIGIKGVVWIDFFSYFCSIAALLLVRIPAIRPTTDAKPHLLQEIGYGWWYLRSRPGLMGLVLLLAASNLLLGFITVLVTPLVLSFSSPVVLGGVMTTAGLGIVAGSIVMGVWGGPKRRVTGVCGFTLLSGAALLLTALPPSAPLIATGAFLFLFGVPIINGCSMAILQCKVAHDVQGRVFAFTGAATAVAMPLAFLLAGPLGDTLEKLFAHHGYLAPTLGRIIGTGPGRGIACAFVLLGMLMMATAWAAYSHPSLRHVEDDLEDATAPEPEAMCAAS